MVSTRLLAVFFATAAGALFIGCGGGGESSPGGGGASGSEADLEVRTVGSSAVDFAFEPASLELTAGQEVTLLFINDSAQPHSFRIDGGVIDTGAVKIGDSGTFTFTPNADSTRFYCTLHGPDTMSGDITIN